MFRISGALLLLALLRPQKYECSATLYFIARCADEAGTYLFDLALGFDTTSSIKIDGKEPGRVKPLQWAFGPLHIAWGLSWYLLGLQGMGDMKAFSRFNS